VDFLILVICEIIMLKRGQHQQTQPILEATQAMTEQHDYIVMGDASKETQPVQESHLRSVLKGITWRVVATASTVTIAWFITGEVQTAFKIGVIEFFAKVFIYYLHERLWQRIQI
jgi:uncharacterized membrane protein